MISQAQLTRECRDLYQTMMPDMHRNTLSVGVAGGSWMFARIHDPGGLVSVRKADQVMQAMADVFLAHGLVKSLQRTNGISYFMDGVVCNWERAQ